MVYDYLFIHEIAKSPITRFEGIRASGLSWNLALSDTYDVQN